MSFFTRSLDSLLKRKRRFEGIEWSSVIAEADLEISSYRYSVWMWSVDRPTEAFSKSSSLTYTTRFILIKQWSIVSELARLAFVGSLNDDGADGDT
jgi:hypothetical protein